MPTRKKIIIISLIIIISTISLIFIFIFPLIPIGSGPYKDISGDELTTILQSNDEYLLINVRSSGEYCSGYIPTAINIEYTVIESNSQLPQDKNYLIILYCRSGSLSAIAAQKLANLGYTNVKNLNGGINAYQGQLISTC